MNIHITIKEIGKLLNVLSVGVVIFDNNKECIYTNRYMFELLNTEINKIYNKFFERIHVEDIEMEITQMDIFFKTKTVNNSVMRLYIDAYGNFRWYKNNKFILGDYYVVSLEDIHDRKTLELKLEDESIRNFKIQKERANFISKQSHSIRSPLNGIIGMITLMYSTDLTHAQIEYLDMLKECSVTLMSIVNDILDFSKLEEGKMILNIEEMNLRECIESTSNIILSKVYEKNIEYIPNINKDIPIYILSDYNRIKQILLNLLYNSVNFTNNGYIYINISKIYEIEYKKYIEKYRKSNKDIIINKEDVFLKVDVIDTGHGIKAEDFPNLFKSYVQLKTDNLNQGTGLGLIISKELVELLNGCIWLDWSEIDKGARFCFVFKTQKSNTGNNELDIIKNEEILQNKKVLVVDDNMYNRISLVNILQKWGMQAVSFSSGKEALISCNFIEYDMGLIDICMPDMDGNELIANIKEKGKKIPLIALSSIGKEHISEDFIAYQIKPIKELKLKQTCIDTLYRSPIDNVDVIIEKRKTLLNNSKIETSIPILIAEDIYINRQVIIKFLKNLGYQNVTEAYNGKECLSYVYKKDYSIILMDIRMPVMDGVEALSGINEYYKNKPNKPYVIAVTAYGQKETYIELGFDDYISKPIDITYLDLCLSKYTNRI